MGELRNLIVVAASMSRRFMREAHWMFASRWPHGTVELSPAATAGALTKIAQWMRIPWFAVGAVIQGTTRVNPGVAMSDKAFREILKDPFSYHQSAGRQDGILAAIQILGYQNARYMDWTELQNCPTWTPPGAGAPVPNQNAFGILCPNFPVTWLLQDGDPAPGTPLDSILRVVRKYKRSSARLCELRISYLVVVDQSWWDAGQDPATRTIVRTQTSTDLDPVKVVDPTP